MEKKLCHFLLRMGIIDKETCSTFLHIYEDMLYENKNFNIFELSYQILLAFINNITNKQKMYFCQNLPLQFLLIRQKNIQSKLRSIIITNQLKYKILLIKYIHKWKYSKKNNQNKSINNKNKHNSFKFNRNSNLQSSNTAYQIHRQKNLFDKDNKDIISDENEIFNISSKPLFSNFFSNNTTTKNSKTNLNFNFTNFTGLNSKGEINKSYSGENIYNKTKQIKTFNNSKIISDLKNSLEFKEEKELEECSFKPKINNLKQSLFKEKLLKKERNKQIQNRFEKLYKDNEKYKLSKQIKALELDYLINKELTFTPSINNSRHLTRENSKENFETRVKTFLAQKKQHSEDIKNKINKELEQNFSFTPKINMSTKITKNNSTQSLIASEFNKNKECHKYKGNPVYLRLYEESKQRNQRQFQKRKEADELITNLSNSKIKNTIIDFQKINELYENKNKSKIEEKTRKKVDKEEGITFKPFLYRNKFAKNIYSNFYERNSKFLQDKEKFITEKKNKINHDKIFSPKEKKQIVENVIGRLYNDSKSFNLTKSGCNKYIKNIKGNFNKTLNINNNDY